VVKTIRADPSLRDHSAAIAVRLALRTGYRCPPLPTGPAPPAPRQ
jgi:hypothetical protein